jgi:hypothetical protein
LHGCWPGAHGGTLTGWPRGRDPALRRGAPTCGRLPCLGRSG